MGRDAIAQPQMAPAVTCQRECRPDSIRDPPVIAAAIIATPCVTGWRAAHCLIVCNAPKVAAAVWPEGNPLPPPSGRRLIGLSTSRYFGPLIPTCSTTNRPRTPTASPRVAAHPRATSGKTTCRASPSRRLSGSVTATVRARSTRTMASVPLTSRRISRAAVCQAERNGLVGIIGRSPAHRFGCGRPTGLPLLHTRPRLSQPIRTK